MAETSETPSTEVQNEQALEVLDPAEELRQINAVVEQDKMKVNDTYYLVAAHWYTVWSDYVNSSPDLVSSDVVPSRPGPVDNSALLEEDGSLKPELIEKNDYELLPEKAWKLLEKWYGGQPVARKVIAIGLQQKAQVELYPIHIKVLYGNQINDLTVSRLATFSDVRLQVASKNNIPPHKHGLFVIEQDEDEPEATASEIGEHLMAQTLEEFQVESGQVFELRAVSVSMMLTQGPATAAGSRPAAGVSSSYWSARVSNTEGKPPVRGAAGLANLGNTCFMNSALQCLSNTTELCEFFLSGRFESDVNEDNPIGMEGCLARAYGSLMADLWADKYSSVAPVDFKKTLGKWAPQFSGYQQQDSQELLSFLLDGLHEDLNRIQKKPYVEAVESNGRSDEVVSAESWDAYKMRNDSHIVDTFQGQLKSKLVCPVCSRTSITFDPLMYLSLPIPVTRDRVMSVLFWPPEGVHHEQLQKHGFVVPKMSSMKDFREVIGERVGLPGAQIVVADVYTGRPFMQPDIKIINDCRTTGSLMAYGVDPVPIDKRMLVPIVQRRPSTYSPASKALFSYPTIVAIEKGVTTYAQLHARASDLVRALVGEDAPAYTLTIAKEYGTTCGICPIAKRCPGCPLPSSDELVPVSAKISVGVDWAVEACDALAKAQKDWKFIEHESCNATLQKDKETIDLAECLDLFTQEETLSKEDSWYCRECKDFMQATKKFDLWRLPTVLVVHLKRFQYSRFFRDKISTNVLFPIEGLSLADYTVGPDKDAVYDLFAVSNHMGGVGGGHYTAYALNQDSGKWFEFNDRRVSEVSVDRIGGSQSYVLFYRKRQATASSSATEDASAPDTA